MTRSLRTLLTAILLALATGGVRAEERFPPPDFTDHKLPSTIVPAPSSALWEYLDLAALAAGLSLASYFALVRRSRRGLFLLSVASLAWLGFERRGCICPIGAIQNVSLAMFDPAYAIPLSALAFFTLPLVFTLFFGRTFCAAVCPLGAAQELVAIRPVRVPAWLEHTLGLLPYVYLGAGVLFATSGTAFLICRYDPFVGFFRRGASANMLILGGAFLVVGVFIGRPYCRYLCPYGAILGVLSKVSKWHVKIPPEDCIQCRLCEDVCPYGAIQEPTVPQGAEERPRARRRLATLLLLLPVLVGLGGWLGKHLAVPLAHLHPTARLAEWVWQDQQQRGEAAEKVQQPDQAADADKLKKRSDAIEAFRNTGRPNRELYAEAGGLYARFAWAGVWLGAWVGLVIGVKLIHLSIRRRRADYQPDRAGCVSCGRCFWYCPSEQVRLGLIQDVAAPVNPR